MFAIFKRRRRELITIDVSRYLLLLYYNSSFRQVRTIRATRQFRACRLNLCHLSNQDNFANYFPLQIHLVQLLEVICFQVKPSQNIMKRMMRVVVSNVSTYIGSSTSMFAISFRQGCVICHFTNECVSRGGPFLFKVNIASTPKSVDFHCKNKDIRKGGNTVIARYIKYPMIFTMGQNFKSRILDHYQGNWRD